jgi:tRNA pseudouridine55 synthase
VRLDGVLVVDKPVGPTSHDVVATARRALRLRRVGHTGTLDPHASGVLPLVVGRATRLAQHLTATEKEYDAVVRFGVETDSYDKTGRIVRETGHVPSREALVAALARFRGAFEQMPPAFSAKNVGGERAYDLARKARAVTLDAAPVVAHDLELVGFDPPRARLRLVCSAGFYVRSLAHDLGAVVGTGAVLDGLVRRRSGQFRLEDAVPFGDVATGDPASLAGRFVPMERLLPDWPAVVLTPEGVRRFVHGREIRLADRTGAPLSALAGPVRLFAPDGRLLGLAQSAEFGGVLRPSVVLEPPPGRPAQP